MGNSGEGRDGSATHHVEGRSLRADNATFMSADDEVVVREMVVLRITSKVARCVTCERGKTTARATTLRYTTTRKNVTHIVRKRGQ